MAFLAGVSTDVLAVHAALVPGGDRGRVLLFGGSEHYNQFSEEIDDNPAEGTLWKKTELYDVATGALVDETIPSPSTDVFCSGHVFLPDGRLIIGGGTAHYGGHGEHGEHDLGWGGHRRCWLYNPTDNEWVEAAQMNTAPGSDSGGGRWYPTLVTLGDGRVAAFFGHPLNTDARHRNTTPEWYSATSNNWHLMPEMAYPYWKPEFDGDPARLLYYARVFVVPDGRLFFATGMPVGANNPPAMGDTTEGGYASTFYNPIAGEYDGSPLTEPSRYSNSWSFPAVLLPLLPTADPSSINGYSTRAMFLGSGSAQWIDLGDTNPQWRDTADRSGAMAGRNRVHGMAVLLPTGQVCAINGVHVQDPEQGTLQAEIFDPGIDWSTGTYPAVAGGGSWSTIDGEAAHTRNYHSVALLLPDGNVWTAGGNTNAGPGNPESDVTVDGATKKRGIQTSEVWEPPYANDSNRPQITSAPDVVTYRQRFRFDMDDASNLERVALIRFGSVTHGHNYDQRYVGLSFERDGNAVFATAPPNGDVAPPGYFMLWAVTSDGLPCQVAPTVRLSSIDCSLILDRSTFGVHEVNSLLGESTPALVENSVYVTVDGFRPSELTTAPVPNLTFADTGGTVPTAQLRLDFDRRLLEDETASADAAQRITFVYHARFGSNDIFDDITELRRVNVSVNVGDDTCTGLLTLLNQPNPYMIDIEGTGDDANPYWLSIDLRVFQISEGEARAGIVQGGGAVAPREFLSGLLTVFNAAAGGPSHPFRDVQESQSQSRLELAETVDGKRVFNYAVARVRYRATDLDAENVQVMFRASPAATTDLRYNPSGTYRRSGDWPNSVALLGRAGGEISSIPFFAAPRVNTVGAGGVPMTTQTDPLNTRMIDAGASEVTEFFGCWLDINQDDLRFPISVDSDGPWPATGARSIKELVRGLHQCLVAEVRFQPGPTDPIPMGAGPSQSDRIAQRNLAIVESDNPGGRDSRTVAHPFEITSSPIGQAIGLAAPAPIERVWDKIGPDELFIRWGNFPRGAEAQLYFGDVDVDPIIAMLEMRPGTPAVRKVDNSTLAIGVTDSTWIPLPGGRATAIPTLLTVRLPSGVVAGQVFRATVSQVSGRVRQVTGSFEFEVPISKAGLLRAWEIHQLSILKHIAGTIPLTNRWHPVFTRYVDVHARRLADFGTDPGLVVADPNGTGGQWPRPGEEPVGDGNDDPTKRPWPGDDPSRPHPRQGQDRAWGRVTRVFFDSRGCLRGFELDDDCGHHRKIRTTDPGMADLILRACGDRLLIEVMLDDDCLVGVVVMCC